MSVMAQRRVLTTAKTENATSPVRHRHLRIARAAGSDGLVSTRGTHLTTPSRTALVTNPLTRIAITDSCYLNGGNKWS